MAKKGCKMKDIILKHALRNAVLHGGKANVNAVLNKVLGELEKKDIAQVGKQVKKVVEEVNRMSVKEQREKLLEMWPNALEKKVEDKKALKPLPGDTSHVVLRIAPNPNAPLHLGASRGVVINGEYAKLYNGKFILRLDDTDPSIKKPLPEAYEWIPEDVRWLGYNDFELVIASDRMEIYYEYAEKLIDIGGAYTCTCPRERFAEYKRKGIECPCRKKEKEQVIKEWKDMLAGKYKEGEIVLRVKTDMKHKNPGLRDWVAFRIKKGEHPRQGNKYIVWPMLDFQSAIDDHLLGISHIIRGKDLMHSTFKQKLLYEKFGWTYPTTLYWGRVKIHEFGKVSSSEIRKGIEEGKYSGWDDPRLPTLRALRKRGIKAEAIREFWLDIGLSERDISASMQILEAINRKYNK